MGGGISRSKDADSEFKDSAEGNFSRSHNRVQEC